MEFLQGTCPVCYCSNTRRRGTVLGRDDREYQVLECTSCTLLFVSPFPRLTDEECREIYDAEYYSSGWGDPGHGYFDACKVACMQAEADRQLEVIVQQTGILLGRILDVGCGDGRYLASFARAGWRAVGIEVSPLCVERAQAHPAMEVIHGTLQSVELQHGSFDVVRLKHSIEHLSFPRETLACVARLLRPGGFLVLDTDNAASLRSRCERFTQRVAGPGARLVVRWLMGKDLRRRFGRLSPPVHLLYFSPRSLRCAVESAGLAVRRIFSVHHGHPIWFPLVHPYRCHPLEAAFRIIDRVGAVMNRGEALVCFAYRPRADAAPDKQKNPKKTLYR